MATPKKRIGAPPKFDREKTIKEICLLVEEGHSLNSIGKMEAMPTYKTIKEWLRADDKFSANYARAWVESAEADYEQCKYIIEDASNDVIFIEEETSQGVTSRAIPNRAALERAKLQVDFYKWSSSKKKPKKYGDRTTTEFDVGETLASLCEEALKHGNRS